MAHPSQRLSLQRRDESAWPDEYKSSAVARCQGIRTSDYLPSAMSDDQYTKNALSSLAVTVIDKAPYFGSLPLPRDSFKIYFDNKDGQAWYV